MLTLTQKSIKTFDRVKSNNSFFEFFKKRIINKLNGKEIGMLYGESVRNNQMNNIILFTRIKRRRIVDCCKFVKKMIIKQMLVGSQIMMIIKNEMYGVLALKNKFPFKKGWDKTIPIKGGKNEGKLYQKKCRLRCKRFR